MNNSGLKAELREALNHLYDPDYRPTPAFAGLLGIDPLEGSLTIQSVILRAIQALRPQAAVSPDSPSSRFYDLLDLRFVQGLTLQETAERMNLSFSSTCRAQRAAVHALARFLWERRQSAVVAPVSRPAALSSENGMSGADDWQIQAQRELAALEASAPDAVSDVEKTIRGTCELLEPVLSRLGVRVEMAFVQPGLTATVHPSAFRQLLIAAILRLAHCAEAAPLTLSARLQDGDVRISIAGRYKPACIPTPDALTADLLTASDVVVEATVQDGEMTCVLELPTVGTVTVLVVDDNLDIARLYQRASEGTRYRIVHVAHGRGLRETIRAVVPDVIVLDVMLPDVDGWDLLMQLQADETTRHLPVVVSSVVKEEELALSLGAACYLPKPVRPRTFIQQLDRLLSPG